ncbi:hypothetical protein [Falsibacillus pallidus]|uniref:Uncharacterized protein n=1 Tax=Falsibacillus pallidus TaxID=493781 RepID=A0A370GP85_9BACI|nr:hypothetical protein [Falsibacillus pallidus]RDI45555.1 hypothetical protein DFR59_102183 [Falsibacillus pallidus]
MGFIDLLAGVTVFYLFRYYWDSDYKQKRKWIVFDIVIATILVFIVDLIIKKI